MNYALLVALLTFSCQLKSVSGLNIIGGSKNNFIREISISTAGLFKNDGTQFCSASLIAEHLLITAAHCISGLKPEDYYVLLKDHESGFKQTLQPLKHQPYDSWISKSAFPNFDVAVIDLQETVDARFRPIEVETDESKLVAETEIILMGYGKFQNRCEKGKPCSGIKKAMPARIKSYLNTNWWRHLLILNSNEFDGVCHGDSGGPAYMKVEGRWKLVGITNGVDRYLTPNASARKCEKGDVIYTFAGRYLNWALSNNKDKLRQLTTLDQVDDKILDFSDVSLSELCRYNRDSDKKWFTIERTLRALRSESLEGSPTIYSDCGLYEKKMLAMREYSDNRIMVAALFMGVTPTRVVDLAIFSKSPLLEKLDITLSSINDLSALARNEKLREIRILGNLNRTKNQRLLGVDKLFQLKSFSFYVNSFETSAEKMMLDLEDLSSSSDIETIQLQNMKILNFESIAKLGKLKRFSCQNCEGIKEEMIPEGVIFNR